MSNDKQLSEEELAELKNEALRVLSARRKSILFSYPFIGSIALRLDLVPVRDFRVRTACTDGSSVYVDISFLNSLSPEEQLFVLAHEVWHTVLMHMSRKQSRDAALFNIATDKEVNYLLAQDKFKIPKLALTSTDEEKGKSAEEIYEMLLKKMEKEKEKKNSSEDNMPSDSSSTSSSSGSSSSKQFDKHIYENDAEEDTDKTCSIVDEWGEVGIDKDFKPHVSKDFAEKMKEAIVSAAQSCDKLRGELPAYVKDLVKAITSPEIRWEELLAQFVTRCYGGSRRSWIPPNRRRVHEDVYVQSRQSSKLKIAVGIDTSGSTQNDRGKFLGELLGLIRTFGDYDLYIIECDAEIGDVKHFTQDDDLEAVLESEDGMELTGGGGTYLTPIFEHVRDNVLDVDCICVMTDGYIEDIPSNPTNLPVLWLVTNDGTMDFCDWGVKVKFKNKSAR